MEAIMEIFPPVDSRNRTQVIRFGGEHLYPLNHLVGSPLIFEIHSALSPVSNHSMAQHELSFQV